MRMPDMSDLIQDLQLAKQIAIEDRNPNAITAATLAQARLLGIDKPNAITDVTPQAPVFNIIGVSPEQAYADMMK